MRAQIYLPITYLLSHIIGLVSHVTHVTSNASAMLCVWWLLLIVRTHGHSIKMRHLATLRHCSGWVWVSSVRCECVWCTYAMCEITEKQKQNPKTFSACDVRDFVYLSTTIRSAHCRSSPICRFRYNFVFFHRSFSSQTHFICWFLCSSERTDRKLNESNNRNKKKLSTQKCFVAFAVSTTYSFWMALARPNERCCVHKTFRL